MTRRCALEVRMRSRCVSTPITLGKPCCCRMLRNSNVSISKPNLASTIMRMRSAALAMSSMAFMSFSHSKKVRRRFLPVTTVTGPLMSASVCFVKRLTSDRISVLLPTCGGPTTATTMGGGSSGLRTR